MMTTRERRTASLFVHLRPSLRRRIDRDATEKGQSLSEWVERALTSALETSETVASLTRIVEPGGE
jgi:predicted HicB family RNase H-like nuclease